MRVVSIKPGKLYIAEKVIKCRIQIYENILKVLCFLWRVRSIKVETIDVHLAELPAFALSPNKRRYINQHLIGYQSVSGFKEFRIGYRENKL